MHENVVDPLSYHVSLQYKSSVIVFGLPVRGICTSARDERIASVCRRPDRNGSDRTWREGGFLYCGEMKLLGDEALNGPVAQLDRVADFYSAGCRFESCRDRQKLAQ